MKVCFEFTVQYDVEVGEEFENTLTCDCDREDALTMYAETADFRVRRMLEDCEAYELTKVIGEEMYYER